MNILRKLRTKDGLIIFLFLVVEFCLWIPILIFSVEPFYTPYKYTSCCLKMAVVVLFPIVAFLLKKNEIFIQKSERRNEILAFPKIALS